MTTDQPNEEKKNLMHFPFTLNQSVGVCVSVLGDLGGRSHQSRFLLNSERAKMAIYQRDRAPSIRMPRSGHTSFPDQYPSCVCVCARGSVCAVAADSSITCVR